MSPNAWSFVTEDSGHGTLWASRFWNVICCLGVG